MMFPSPATKTECRRALKNSASRCRYRFCAMSVPNGAFLVDTQAIAITMTALAKLSEIPRNPANRDSPLERPDLILPGYVPFSCLVRQQIEQQTAPEKEPRGPDHDLARYYRCGGVESVVGDQCCPRQQASDDCLHPAHVGDVGDEPAALKKRIQGI